MLLMNFGDVRENSVKKGIFRRLRSVFRRESEKITVTEIKMPVQGKKKRGMVISKNCFLLRKKSACCGFPRLIGVRYGDRVFYRGPTHFTCGPGFPKLK